MAGKTLWRLLAALLLAMPLAAQAEAQTKTIDVTLFAINDLHGNLLPPEGGVAIVDPKNPKKKASIAAGGVEYMAALIKSLRASHPNSIFVAAGDLVGASPLPSSLFHDEPTIEAMNLMGLEVSSVGNHEFDRGPAELLRKQKGGCSPVDGCKGPHPFTGAKFHYLAANVIVKATGKTLLPPYYIKRIAGVPIGFIGLTLQGTDALVSPRLNAGITFKDEAKTVNALVPKLQAQGVKTIIVLIHQGAYPKGGTNSANYNGCTGMTGAILGIVPKLDKAVQVVVSGHTHEAYNCMIDGRLVTSAHRYSTMVTEIDLTLDATTHALVSKKAENLIVRDQGARDPDQTQLIAAYQKLGAPLENRVVGHITADLSKTKDPAGEFALGDVIADDQIAASMKGGKGAVIAFINSGGVRVDIVKHPGKGVTFADIFAAQPFSNRLVTVDLTGAQIKALLEQQWGKTTSILQVSKGFTYSWDFKRPNGSKVVPGSIKLDGKPIVAGALYRIATLDYVADGGDGFTVMKAGRNRTDLMPDIDATEAYFKAHDPIAPPVLDRIQRLN